MLVDDGSTRCRLHTGVDAAALAVETTRGGQQRLRLPKVPRQIPAAWNRKPCAPCARMGIDKPGEPRGGEGSEPECQSCWRGRQDRAARQALRDAETWRWDHAAEVADAAVCAACGADEPTLECWLCGFTWLQQARREYELEQLAERAAVDAEFARMADIAELEMEAARLEHRLEHARAIVEAYTARSGWGRPVVLLADVLARDAARRTSLRGKPNESLAHIGAVMVLDCDPRSGNRSMPGRAETAQLAGVGERTVTGVWRHMEKALGWMTRTQQGRKLTLAERRELGRSYDRAQFNLAPLHQSPIDADTRAAWEPLALAAIGDLIETLAGQLSALYEALDGLRARSGADVDWAEQTRRAQLRQAASRAATTTQDIDRNLFPPRVATNSEYVSSCLYWGFGFSRENSRLSGGRPDGRRGDGASRSSTRSPRADLETSRSGKDGRQHTRRSHPVRRPRTLQQQRPAQRQRARRPDWADWAPDLARDLRERWTWLADVPLAWVQATLGAALGRDWTAEALDDWVRAQHGALLGRPARPARYLKTLLAEVLTGDAEPPHPAQATVKARRERVRRERDQLRAAQDVARADAVRREDDAWLTQAGVNARQAARTIAAGARRTDEPRTTSTSPTPNRDSTESARPTAVALADPRSCEVAWHGCAGDVSTHTEPWPGGRTRHYCASCANAITATWTS